MGLAIIILSLVTHFTASNAMDVHLLRPFSRIGDHPATGVSCDSWRFAIETNNMRGWLTVPPTCENYVGNYMIGGHYRNDSAVVIAEAMKYVTGLELGSDGKDVWIFDIDETSISNLPYYAHHGFGVEAYNDTSFNAWVRKSRAPALPESLKLYKKLMSLGIKIIFLSGRSEDSREATACTLKRVGYYTWEKLILRRNGDKSLAMVYKSGVRKTLVKQGYKIVGNIGDQWSDILGSPEGDRTFKLPDPMYYYLKVLMYYYWSIYHLILLILIFILSVWSIHLGIINAYYGNIYGLCIIFTCQTPLVLYISTISFM
ncbi:putative Acid phosphatase [Dioscorea sansibarensis]